MLLWNKHIKHNYSYRRIHRFSLLMLWECLEPRSNIPWMKMAIGVTGSPEKDSCWRLTSVANNSPSKDSNHIDDHFQWRYFDYYQSALYLRAFFPTVSGDHICRKTRNSTVEKWLAVVACQTWFVRTSRQFFSILSFRQTGHEILSKAFSMKCWWLPHSALIWLHNNATSLLCKI